MKLGMKALRLPSTAHLQARPVGNALLIHRRGELDEDAARFAGVLSRDPQHTLAVVDLPDGALETEWEQVARLLARRPGSVRLVFGRSSRQEILRAGQRIADRLDRVVVASDGEVLPTASGGLFIPSDHGAGWLPFRAGRAAQGDWQRFPKPQWEFTCPNRPWATSKQGIIEPVPPPGCGCAAPCASRCPSTVGGCWTLCPPIPTS